MNDFAIVVLSGYPDIFRQFVASQWRYERDTPVILITSGQMSDARVVSDHLIQELQGIEPFCFARNANRGVYAAGRKDVFLVNDDVQFLRQHSIADLARIAHANPQVGILSPQFEGRVGNRLQESVLKLKGLAYTAQRLCFTGVYIRRKIIDEVGFLDERFDGYGREDDQYCMRVQDAGYKLAVTPEVIMRHGFGAVQHSSSYRRMAEWPVTGIDPRMTAKWNEWLKERKK